MSPISKGRDDANCNDSLWRSQQAANARTEEWEPQTREEAQQRWKDMQNTPDHLTLLHMYKRAGVEPIKVAKSVSPHMPPPAYLTADN